MKKRALAFALAGCCLLSGCKVMLERSYSTITPHADRPHTAEDPSVLRVENYQELVSAVLYLVSQHTEEGTIQLHNYDGDEETDLSAACLEVSTQDPLGAYAVDYIKSELSRVVSYYQATLAIRYRRSGEQMENIVSVNGSGAIRDQLLATMADCSTEAVLRVPYFSGDEDTVKELLEEAYYAHPALALGLPQVEVSLYPDSGRERIVEIELEYPEEAESLKEKREELAQRAEELLGEGTESREKAPQLALEALRGSGVVYDRSGGSTAYAALVEGQADSRGLALGYALLCTQAGSVCQIQAGTLDGEERFWVAVELPDREKRYVDPCRALEGKTGLYQEEEFFTLGYFLSER